MSKPNFILLYVDGLAASAALDPEGHRLRSFAPGAR
jgi:hypothetical protein